MGGNICQTYNKQYDSSTICCYSLQCAKKVVIRHLCYENSWRRTALCCLPIGIFQQACYQRLDWRPLLGKIRVTKLKWKGNAQWTHPYLYFTWCLNACHWWLYWWWWAVLHSPVSRKYVVNSYDDDTWWRVSWQIRASRAICWSLHSEGQEQISTPTGGSAGTYLAYFRRNICAAIKHSSN